MRRFTIKMALFSLPVLILVVATNWIVDPAELFRDDISKLTTVITKGNHIAGLENYDERLFQQKWIGLLDEIPETIVLGSSRGMLINRGNTLDSTLLNHCVSGARFEDLIGIYQLYNNKPHIPKRVILEISPYMFNENYKDTRYVSIEESYKELAEKLNLNLISHGYNNKWIQLFSLSYFQNSFAEIKHPKDRIEIISSDSTLQDKLIKRCDGSIVYPRVFQTKGLVPKELAAGLRYGDITAITILSAERQFMFESFVNFLILKGREVRIFLAPIPDPIYRQRPICAMVERYVRQFAAKSKLHIIGSYQCSAYNIDEKDFYDWMHPNQKTCDLIIKEDLLH